MKPEEILKQKEKISGKATTDLNIRIVANTDRTIQKITFKEGEKKYPFNQYKDRDLIGQGVKVYFKQPQQLTIFQAGLLICLYVLKRLPRDYGGYFKCPAGKEFAENIEKVNLLVKKEIVEIEEKVI